MKPKGIDFIINQHRNKSFWRERDVNDWIFKGLSSKLKIEKNVKKNDIVNFKHFFLKTFNEKNEKKYITFGKGFDN